MYRGIPAIKTLKMECEEDVKIDLAYEEIPVDECTIVVHALMSKMPKKQVQCKITGCIQQMKWRDVFLDSEWRGVDAKEKKESE